MAKAFTKLRQKMSKVAQEHSSEIAQKILVSMPLQELRQAREMSQKQLAEALSVRQASISKLERRTDMYIHSLRHYIEAMGGHLDIIARFPDGEVRVNQFENIDKK